MNLPLVILIALTIAWMAATAAGVTLLLLGLRGRRADFLRRCRSCRYVIDGGFDSTTCPECGADIRESGTILVGRRRINEPQLAFGVILLVVSAAPVVMFAAGGTNATIVSGAGALPAMNGQAARGSRLSPASLSLPNIWASDQPNDYRASTGDVSAVDRNAPQLGLLEHAGLHTALKIDLMPDNDIAPPTAVTESVVKLPEPTLLDIDVVSDLSITVRARTQTVGVLGGMPFDFAQPTAGWNSALDVDSLESDLLQLPSRRSLVGPAVRYEAPAAAASPWSNISATTSDSMHGRVKSAAIKPPRIGQRSR